LDAIGQAGDVSSSIDFGRSFTSSWPHRTRSHPQRVEDPPPLPGHV